MFEDKKHVAIEGKEMALIVATNPDGTKNIMWHGPVDIYSTHSLNGNKSSITANYTTDGITYTASLKLGDNTKTDTITRAEMYDSNRSQSGSSYTTDDRSDIEGAGHLYTVKNNYIYMIKGWLDSPLFDSYIDYLYYSGQEFLEGKNKTTTNTLPGYKKENVSIVWEDIADNGSTDGSMPSQIVYAYINNDLSWPLVVKYNPSIIVNCTTAGFACWYLETENESSFTNYLIFDKVSENGKTFYEKQVAQLQFGSEYGQLTEQKIQELIEAGTIDNNYITWPWHFHFYGNYFKMDDTVINSNTFSQLFLRCHHFSYYNMTSSDGTYLIYYNGTSSTVRKKMLTGLPSTYQDEVILKYTDRLGNTAYTNVWEADPNETYNMYCRMYKYNDGPYILTDTRTGTSSTDYWTTTNLNDITFEQPDPDLSIKYVYLTLKKTPTVLQGIKLAKDLAPFCRRCNQNWTSQTYIMSYEVANDIWNLDSLTRSDYLKQRTDSTGKFNKTAVPDWFDEDSNTKINIDNSIWSNLGTDDVYESFYDMCIGIFESPVSDNINKISGIKGLVSSSTSTYSADKLTRTRTIYYKYGFCYCEKVNTKISEDSYAIDFSSSVLSTITVGSTTQKFQTSNSDLSSYKCKVSGNKIVPDTDNISEGDSIGQEVITYSDTLQIWSDVESKYVEVPGCVHKVLDSNVEYGNDNNATVFTTRDASSPKTYYGEVNQTTGNISYKECEASDSKAWKYTIVTD